jgi:hypothetical protein
MNVFVLSTGRTGTMSLERACRHISNYTVSHESRCNLLGEDRLRYPKNHIEIDNRLSWFLGRLEKVYGDDAIYVHMRRNEDQVARSYVTRWNRETSIIRAYAYGILKRQEHQIDDPMAISKDYVQTVDENIEAFLENKPRKMTFHLENAAADFPRFWSLTGAEGDQDSAWQAFNDTANTSTESSRRQNELFGKIGRIIKKLPSFMRNA